MAGSRSTRQLGIITRIYKNSNGKVIAVDDVSIEVDELRISDTKYHRSVRSINKCRTKIHLELGNRVVALIQTFGNFNSILENSGDYLVPTWLAASVNENDIEVQLTDYVAKLGDTL